MYVENMKNKTEKITVMGLGNILLTDEGFGVHVIRKLCESYEFPDNVELIDGGVLGFNLLSIILETDKLIVVDVIQNSRKPGTLYRIAHHEIPNRIKAKNSLHQLDFLETLTKCQAIGDMPETVIIGTEPQDIETFCLELTPKLNDKINAVVDMVLSELNRLNVSYTPKDQTDNVCRNSCQNSGN